VPLKKRVYNSVSLVSDVSGALHQNVLLTGPNRGGKSTLLKALGTAVLMSQTVGIVFAREAWIPRFTNIITALAPADVVGKLSLFEAEIEFAKDVKSRLGPLTFLMMDEIFHGTNAHDGVEASQVFLDQLYDPKVRGLFSVVSTHYMDLPERYKGVQQLCMEASVNPDDPDRLVYTYKVCGGVNRFSSVREILRERGLLGSRPRDSRPRGSAD
jgi:DNA mismatch repair protein MutS